MPRSTLLRRALRANAAFSGACATLFLAAGDPISRAIGLPEGPILPVLGVGLAGFAVFLLVTAGRSDIRKLQNEGLTHSLADFAWVIGSAPVIAFGPMNTTGNLALAAVSAVVLALGLAQWIGVQRLRQTAEA